MILAFIKDMGIVKSKANQKDKARLQDYTADPRALAEVSRKTIRAARWSATQQR